MDASPLRVALVGCGENAKTSIVPAIEQTDLARVVATMDIKLDLARDLARETGAAMCTDVLADVLENDDVEAVVVSTPHHLHAPQGIEAARQSKHVLMDKPLAVSVADAKQLIATCADAGVELGVLFPMRAGSYYAALKHIVEQGVLGRVTGYSCCRVWQKPDSYWSGGYSGRVQTDWRTRKAASGGGMLMINYSHNLDRLHSLLGLEPQRVYAQCDTFHTPVEVEDYFSVVVRYRCGAIGTLLGSSATPGGIRTPDQVFGTAGTISLDEPLRFWTEETVAGYQSGAWNEIPCVERPTESGYRAIIENFCRAVRGREPLAISGENALSSLRVVEAAYRSQETGAPVILA